MSLITFQWNFHYTCKNGYQTSLIIKRASQQNLEEEKKILTVIETVAAKVSPCVKFKGI